MDDLSEGRDRFKNSNKESFQPSMKPTNILDEGKLLQTIWAAVIEPPNEPCGPADSVKAVISPRTRAFNGVGKLTEADLLEILYSNENPREILKKFQISFYKLRAIKAGRKRGGIEGGSEEHWYAYAGRHLHTVHRLEEAQRPTTPRSRRQSKEALLDVLTSSEPPSVLQARWGYRLGTIRQMKSGNSKYVGQGGSQELWDEYHTQHYLEWRRLFRLERSQPVR